MRLICFILLLALSLSACGHKGPLYMPQNDESDQFLQKGMIKK
ncbi:MAG: lipoprotein [Pseudomonadota bacterium]